MKSRHFQYSGTSHNVIQVVRASDEFTCLWQGGGPVRVFLLFERKIPSKRGKGGRKVKLK